MKRWKKGLAVLLVLLFVLPFASGRAEAAAGSWKKDSGGYKYVYSNGKYAKKEWIKAGKKKYYIKANGYMATGWLKIGGKWYYFQSTGAMKTGWLQDGGKWYYLDSKGVMVTGKVTIGGKAYTFGSNGVMKGSGSSGSNYKVGDVIKFGHYEQDAKTSNGKEAIEWVVMEKRSDGSLLLLSKYGLDAQPYNKSLKAATWQKCSLRKWLNSTFYNAAFSAAEKKKIQKTTVVNNDNFFWGTEGGNNTKDYLFLLSDDEAKNLFKDDDGKNAGGDSHSRACRMTKYAISQGAWELPRSEWWAKNCWYWLRSPGMYSNYAAYVFRNGYVSYDYDGIDYLKGIVRPALVYNP